MHYGNIGQPVKHQLVCPFWLVHGKPCHFPIELQHKAFWAVMQCKMNIDDARVHRKLQMNKLEELKNQAYESSII